VIEMLEKKKGSGPLLAIDTRSTMK
jgi:hypothetical protein